MEYAVGTRITLELEVVENEGCEGCFFDCGLDGCLKPFYAPCASKFRPDHKNIIFKEVK